MAAIGILVASDGMLIQNWKYPPTVYLSVAYTISNILVAAAFSEAVTVGHKLDPVEKRTY